MKTTIYIRVEDEEKWAEIENKSEWVADMLNGNEVALDRRVRRIVQEELQNMQSGNY